MTTDIIHGITSPLAAKPWYQRCYRRMLVDMHIPDWNPEFLSKYDPAKMAEYYERAGLTSVMFYCMALNGLCFWPTGTGKMHANLAGRDVVAEMLWHLKRRGIASCAYYIVIWNNWAFLEHPEWRLKLAANDTGEVGGRTGVVCPNNPGYRELVAAHLGELAGGYDFDGFFIDMNLWPQVCLCPHCVERFQKETGRREIPGAVNWLDPAWCDFAAARERWICDYAGVMKDQLKGLKPGMSVYHNYASAPSSWIFGNPLEAARHQDFLGGDFYGSPVEQQFVVKLMMGLTENKPVEFMTTSCVSLLDHVRQKRFEEMEMQAFAATLYSSAFLFINAIDPVGTVNPATYDWIGQIFKKTAPYEPFLGGEPVEEIALYFSNESKMDFADDGMELKDVGYKLEFPHLRAIHGATRILQQAHLPFGVITRKQLGGLDRYKVIILPNILRMDREEVQAFRDYVAGGGRLYASRYTSLTESKGQRHDDFMLADLFGCHFEQDDLGPWVYLKPAGEDVAERLWPQNYASLTGKSALRISEQAEAEVLATLSLPYAHPHPGAIFDQNWASFWSCPPWEDTRHPVLVRNTFGKGEVIYCASDIESLDSGASDRLFLFLIEGLLGAAPVYHAETHPGVWMNVMEQGHGARFLIGFLNYQAQLPAAPIARIPFTLRAPAGRRFTKLLMLPGKTSLAFSTDEDGTLHAEAPELKVFHLLLAETE